jgi:hypothetical protein
VPVITYGFDQSFLNYFGTNGVQAVESAIQVFNDLPPSSQIVLTNYPFHSKQINFTAEAAGLYDLKSETLSLLLEQMGLTQPTRYIYVIHHWDPLFISTFGINAYNWPDWIYPYFIAKRNFDPETFDATSSVNRNVYSAYLFSGNGYNVTVPFNVNPFDSSYSAVADFIQSQGEFYTGLTYDDVGGLAYLYSSNNINFETVLPDVHVVNTNLIAFTTNTISPGDRHRPPRAHGPPVTVPPPHGTIIVVVTNVVTSTNVLVNGAWRPGVEKITFVPQLSGSQPGSFLPQTNFYTDTYFSNGVARYQQVQRITTSPDFLFCAGDMFLQRTGTTNWLNNSFLNENTNGEGPGIIVPPVKIALYKLGSVVYTSDSDNGTINQSWASFGSSTNLSIVYPQGVQPNHLTVQFFFFENGIEISNQTFSLSVPIGGTAALQISTDQINWVSLATVTNAGSVIEWNHNGSDNPPKFFRAMPQ